MLSFTLYDLIISWNVGNKLLAGLNFDLKD